MTIPNDIPAGDELDRLVATKVMGWEQIGGRWWDTANLQWARDMTAFRPSVEIAHAWEVLAKWTCSAIRDGVVMAELGREWEVAYACTHNKHSCNLMESGSIFGSGFAATAPHAICLAALAAVSR